jgi:hypothetical protein
MGTMQDVRILSTQNAVVDFDTQQNITGAYTYTPQAGTTSLTFTIRRPSSGASTVPMIVTDGCGEWRTLAGAGPGVS